MKNDLTQELLNNNASNACIVFSDGQCLWGKGFGHEGISVAEICFNTAMTGYQEILTDLSYAGQIINFTFPHIGNTGTNVNDNESNSAAALGMITRNMPTKPSHWQTEKTFDDWLKKNKVVGIGNIDTRKVTHIIRSGGAQMVTICYSKSGGINIAKLKELTNNAVGLEGKELTADVTCLESFSWQKPQKTSIQIDKKSTENVKKINIVAVDYGAKWSIFNRLANSNREVQVIPANSSFDTILSLKPDGVFLSNGPGDPLATFNLFGGAIVKLLRETQVPIFGICLGHQILGLAAGATTIKMLHGHHGANHPVLDLESGKVEITSMNHGFTLDKSSLPRGVTESHISLFDRSNCGIEIAHRHSFSVQYHPEASPGPQDSYYLFEKFYNNINSCAEKNNDF